MKTLLKRIRSEPNLPKQQEPKYTFDHEQPPPLQIFSANDMQARGVNERMRETALSAANYLAQSVGSQREVANVSHLTICTEQFGEAFITFLYTFEAESASGAARGLCPLALAHRGINEHASIDCIMITDVSEHTKKDGSVVTHVTLRVRACL